MERPQALLPGVITFCPCAEGFPLTLIWFADPQRLPPSRFHHPTRVQVVAGPNELRVAHIFPQIIPFFTFLRRRRCTPNEYQHDHESNCNIDELLHRFLLVKHPVPSKAGCPGPSPGRLRLSRKPITPFFTPTPLESACLRRQGRPSIGVYFFSGRPAMPVFR
jgi:hypothetical protein